MIRKNKQNRIINSVFRQIRIFVLLVLSFSSKESFAQNPLHKQLTISNGFFSNTIYDIYQDKKGFIWFATEDGLARFDGLNYKIYPVKNNKSYSFSNILETSDGRIWVQNFSGQFFFTKNDSLIYKPEISVYKNFMVASVIKGKTLVVFTPKGLRLFNTETNKHKDVFLNDKGLRSAVISSNKSYSLFSPKSSYFYEIDENGILKKKKSTAIFNNHLFYLYFNNKHILASKINDSLCFDSKRFLLKNKLKKSIIQNIAYLSNNEIGVLTTSGFILVNNQQKESKLYFPEFSCSKAIRDNEGNLWVGTINDGVLFIPQISTIQYLEQKNITSLFVNEKQKKCLIGTKNNEIYTFDLRTKKLELLLKKTVNHEIKCLFQNPYSDELIYCSEFVYHLDAKRKVKERLLVSANHISLLDREHYLLSESNTLTIYPIQKNDPWLRWKTDKREPNGKRFNLIGGNKRFYKAFFFKNKIVAHSADGLWEFTPFGEKKIVYEGKALDVLTIEKSIQGLLILTADKGVLLYDGNQLKSFIKLNQFQDEKLYRIKASKKNVFIVTYSGIEVFDFKGNKQYDVLRSDGFPGIDVIEFDVLENTVYTANVIGFIPIEFSKKLVNSKKSNLVLNAFFINQKNYEFKQNSRLNTNENSLQFSFSILDYKAENSSQILYSINNKDWVLLKGRDLNLNELQYGIYHIRVKAKNMRGQFSNQLVFDFEIDTPFYKELWFILLAILTSLFGIGFIVWFRFKEIRSKNRILQEKIKIEKELYKSTLSSIKAQMNPHFLFNALNTIQSFIYTNDRKTASSYLVSFSELTRMILDMSNRELVSLSEEITALNLYLKLEKMRFEDDFSYVMNTENLPHQNFQIPSMLIQPYVENAIKHGLLHKKGERKLEIRFEYIQSILNVQIEDNGIGIEASQKLNKSKNQKHESFSTHANQKRFEILNQMNQQHIGVEIITIKNEDNSVKGTLVSLSIPVN